MAKETVLIIDYGSGNLRSAAKSFEHVIRDQAHDCSVIISNKPEDILKATRLVLPGQGAFRDCMNNLKNTPGMVESLRERVLNQGVPFLGICVGMQLMATRGLEHGSTAGLNWVEGEVVPIKPENPDLKIPHMGWNELHFPDNDTLQDNRHFVLRNTSSSENYYFVHSFMFQCTYNHHCLAYTDYGEAIPAMVGHDNMIGTQFHPEKSHDAGLKLLSNFLDWKP
ncbi:MAG: imidazole glycerol phosphate synthase subunit HisH [Alphaproteobacteria bacterium]|nr:imidazole glycerol phosphate synthase subunit HisH [Alphaproteobacteria bacterium]